jgi:biotin carboxyl carrier protein
MKYEVGIDGRSWTIDIEPRGGVLAVHLGGHQVLVDAARVEGGLSLIFPDERISRDIRIEPGRAGEMTVRVAGATIPVTVQRSDQRARGGQASGSQAATGARRVVAPMPGRIVRVLVGAGERVAARQSLVVIEAMKMENELKAPKAGVVTIVQAVEGATVDAGAVLAVVE